MNNNSKYRFLFAGGGTGGHIFPAIAVAEKIRELIPDVKILFVGTSKKIESEVVPSANFDFKTIWISGFSRGEILNNLLLLVKIPISLIQSYFIVKSVKPTVAIGSGAYVSAPIIKMASMLKSKVVLLEQNYTPGISNRLLQNTASEIHTTFKETEKYFSDRSRVYHSGNPIRSSLKLFNQKEAKQKLNLDDDKKVLLVVGGSGGAFAINEAVRKIVESKIEFQIVWSTGNKYYSQYKKYDIKGVRVISFIDEMATVYSAADLILTRAGSTTLTEISVLGLASVLVPSPNVADDHQTKNAKYLEKIDAVKMIEEKNLHEELAPIVGELLKDQKTLLKMRENIKRFAKSNAAEAIAKRILSLAEAA